MATASKHEIAIHWLEDPWSRQTAVVGGKAAALGRLIADFPVPPGFCLTWEPGPEEGVPQDAYGPALASAYQTLAQRCGRPEPPVAVRSSAVDEDGHTASFAGLNETFLNVAGHQAVAESVRNCLASFRSSRAEAYRRHHGMAHTPSRFAVLIQQLVVADCSGVAFSVDPITGNRDEVIVNASWGLGESVVGGTVTPDTYVVGRGDRGTIRRQIADKRTMTVAVPGGVAEVGIPRRLRDVPTLTDDQITATARLALELEQRTGHPVDVEFAWADGRLHLLQCRPVTTLTDAFDPQTQVPEGPKGDSA